MAALNQEQLLGDLIPDVYVGKISLESAGTTVIEDNPHIDHAREHLPVTQDKDANGLVVNLDLIIKEKLDNDLIGTWFGDHQLTKYLKVKIVQSEDPRLTTLFGAASDTVDLVDRNKTVSKDDLRMKVAGTLLGVNSVQEINEFMAKKATVREFSVSKDILAVDSKLTQYKETVDDEGNRVFDVPFRQRFELKRSNPQHLAYFIVTSLDLEALARDFNIDFNKIGLSSMNGKLISEVVIDDFHVVARSFVFFDPGNKIWTGPVHQLPNGQFRTGSREDRNSVDLTKFVLANTKVQDFRDVKEIERLMIDFSLVENEFLNESITKRVLTNDRIDSERKPIYFSNMLLSRDKDGDSKFFFSVDFDKLTEENTVFGRLITNAAPRLRQSVVQKTKIRAMRVFRRRVKENGSLNQLGSSVGITHFDRQEPDEYIISSGEKDWKNFSAVRSSRGSLKEVEVILEKEQPSVRHFTGMDYTMSDVTDGLYQYGVELEVDDSTIELMRERVNMLINARVDLEYYLAEASVPSMSRYLAENRDPHIDHPSESAGTKGVIAGAFDVASNRFTQDFATKQRKKYSGNMQIRAPWIAAVTVYADTLDLFTGAFRSRDVRSRLLKSLHSYTSPITGNPSGISTVIKLIDELATKLALISGTTLNVSPRKFDGSTSSTRQPAIYNQGKSAKRTYKIVKFFDQTFDSDIVKGVGADYLSDGPDNTANADGLRTFKNNSYVDRINSETLKYYKDTNPDINLSLGSETFTSDDNIRNTNFSYLSPSRIDLFHKSIVLAEGVDISNPPDTKTKKRRMLVHIDNGTTSRDDAATEIQALTLYQNSTRAPVGATVARSISGGLTSKKNKGKMRNDPAKITQETISNALSSLLAEQASVVITPIVVNAKKDDATGATLLRATPRSRAGAGFITKAPNVETDVSKRISSQQGEDAGMSTEETQAKNTFMLALLASAVQTGDSSEKNKRSTRNKPGSIMTATKNRGSLINEVSMLGLKSKSVAGRPGATRTIHGLNRVITDNDIKALPNQLKAVFLQSASQNVTRQSKFAGIGSGDATIKQRQASSLRLDFEMLMKIEYLAGFEVNARNTVLMRQPIWKMLTDEKNNQFVGKDVLCRMTPYENEALGLRRALGVQTTTYDEYFILSPKFKRAPIRAVPLPLGTNDVVVKIADQIKLNIPGVDVTVVREPTPLPSPNNAKKNLPLTNVETNGGTSGVTVHPVSISIVEIDRFGEKRTTTLALSDEASAPSRSLGSPGLVAGVQVGPSNLIVRAEPVTIGEMLALDCQTNEVPSTVIATATPPNLSMADQGQALANSQAADANISDDQCVDFVAELTKRIGHFEGFSLPALTQAQARSIVLLLPDNATNLEVLAIVIAELQRVGLMAGGQSSVADEPLAERQTVNSGLDDNGQQYSNRMGVVASGPTSRSRPSSAKRTAGGKG